MRERPILFSSPMVRAILSGAKTQTRRVVKHARGAFWDHAGYVPRVATDGAIEWSFGVNSEPSPYGPRAVCPYGGVGDRLWVRETWAQPETVTYYRSTDAGLLPPGAKWKPSIHMPRWASRLTLEVTGVRVERLQDISPTDALAEGITIPMCTCEPCLRSSQMCTADESVAVESFRLLWESINGAESWDANPWVWIVEFKRVEQGGE